MFMRYYLLAFILILFFYAEDLFAQQRKSVQAVRIQTPLIIDGKLNDEVYLQTLPAKDFVQLTPYNGKPSPQASEVYFFYDDEAVYVGAMLFDTAPDSIFNNVSVRDNIGMSDYFGVYFDPYNQGQLSYGFYTNPGGTQIDMKAIRKDYDDEDLTWNAVWYCKTSINEKGWVVEMKIPYSELRIPDKDVHTWGLNMFRRIRRLYTNTSWNLIDRKLDGFIHQQGKLTGIRNINPPVRLSFTPYSAAYIESGSSRSSSEFLYKGGLDMKYGIGESYTLDMMLIPDFGQVQSDDQELNLSPFELYYDENRQFFNEGTELFQRGDIFYSRRIGASPLFSDRADESLRAHEKVSFLPSETRLVNATKFSGRGKNGLAVGVLNAMSLPSNAELKDTLTEETREVQVQPLTNYNITVLDKSLKNNSYISFINTNMKVLDSDFMANVTATEYEFRDKSRTFAVKGKGGLSTRGSGQKDEGWFGELGLTKNYKNAEFGITQEIYSEKFDPNDMGYLRRDNYLQTEAYAAYQILEPFSIFNELTASLWTGYNRVYEPFVFANLDAGTQIRSRFKNNYFMYLVAGRSTKHYNYYEPRVSGRYVTEPAGNFFFFYIRSDRNKKLSFDVDYDYMKRLEGNWKEHQGEFEVQLRLGRRFEVEYGIAGNKNVNEKGFVDMNDAEDSIYFANREVNSLSNKIEASYIINKDVGIHLRTRHYWSSADNDRFFRLNNEGLLDDAPEFSGSENQNYNAFTLDMDFRWIFAPGSEMILAWKRSIFTDGEQVIPNYWENVELTRRADYYNSISLKVLYYLDYNRLFGKNG